MEQVAQGVMMPSWETTPRSLPEEDVPAPSFVVPRQQVLVCPTGLLAPGPVRHGPCMLEDVAAPPTRAGLCGDQGMGLWLGWGQASAGQGQVERDPR